MSEPGVTGQSTTPADSTKITQFGQQSHRTGPVDQGLVVVVNARGIEVPKPVRDWLVTCADVDQLDVWLRRAPFVSSLSELFAA